MDTKYEAVNVVGPETEALVTTELRRPPKKGDLEEILVIHDPDAPLKSERVEEELRAMPEWVMTLEGDALTRAKELPTPEVATLYTAYVTGLAGALGQAVNVSVSDGLVFVTLYAPGGKECAGGVTESVLEFARQMG